METMILEIDYHSGVPIYRQVVGQIERLVLSGALPEGQQLESVRDLSERLKVNPMTVSKAYSILEREEYLERRRGVGLFIAKLKTRQKEQQSRAILDDLLGKAAAAAVQMGVQPQEAIETFTDHYKKFQSKQEDSK
jgi:GntR family transcriptional regulator